MAITATTSAGSNGNQSSGASLAITVATADILPGDVIVVAVAADNAGASGASSVSSVTDSQSHSYTLRTQNRTAGSAANDGCTAVLAYARCTKKMVAATDTITVNFSPNTTAKAIRYAVFRGMEDVTYSTSGVGGSGTTYNNGNTATASVTSGDIVIGVVASESNTLPTGDSDTSNGSWVANANSSGGGGGDGTKMAVSLQYKIVTGTATQTLNGTCANSDWAVVWGLFTVPTSKSDTETGSGSESASVDTGAQPTDDDPASAVDAGESVTTIDSIGPSDDPVSAVDAGESIANTTSDSDTGSAVDAQSMTQYYTDADGGAAVIVCLAKGGAAGASPTGGQGGQASAGVGDVKFSGGNGADGGIGTGNQPGGGGGGSAGTASDGNNGSGVTGGSAVTGGVAGGNGGAADGSPHLGTQGTAPGGASGGSSSTAASNGGSQNGSNGQVRFTYTPSGTVNTYTPQPALVNQLEVPPAGTTQVVVECWGATGRTQSAVANTNGSGGAGGGAYSKTTIAWTTGLVFRVRGGQSGSLTSDLDMTVWLTSAATATDAGESITAGVSDNDDPASSVDGGESLDVVVSADEPASADDAGETIAVAASDDDPASTVDDEGIAAGFDDGDTVTSDETHAVAASVNDDDPASGIEDEDVVESGGATTPIDDTDSASTVDAEHIAVALVDSDDALSDDAQSLVVQILEGDTASAVETAASIVAAVTANDDGTVDEFEIVVAYLSDEDAATAVDAGESVIAILLPPWDVTIIVDDPNTVGLAHESRTDVTVEADDDPNTVGLTSTPRAAVRLRAVRSDDFDVQLGSID